MTKKCPKCGVENDDNAKFCKKCGHSYSGDIFTEEKDNRNKNIIIIAVTAIICIALVAGAIMFLNQGNSGILAQNDPIKIINTTFETGHSLDAKTVCTINLGENHSGENVSIEILYSRDGENLNDGDKTIETIGQDGTIVCESKDSYGKYPDHASVTVYDSEGNLLDSVDVSLETDDSKQLAIGNGTVTAKSITEAAHSAGSSSDSGSSGVTEWVEDLDLSDKAGYDCHVYIHHRSDGTKYYYDDEGTKHSAPESQEWVF